MLLIELDAGAPLDEGRSDRLRRCRDLITGLDPYLERCTTPESVDLARLAARTRAVRWDDETGSAGRGSLEQEMLSGHVEGELLKMLVHAAGASRVLEIGTFTGYSALAMAEALGPDGVVLACEIDGYAAAIARDCFAASEVGHKIDVRVAPALDTLATLAGHERFELVFIDADKGGYRDYLAAVLDLDLLAAGGLICVDNTLMQGLPWMAGESTPNGEAIADFNETVAGDARVAQVILPMRDGMTLIRRIDRRRAS